MNSRETRRAAAAMLAEIQRLARPMRLMEVCGTHTTAICASGIRGMLPPEIELVSGPGCPVCVTPNCYIDQAIAYCKLPGMIVASFGDMLKVPGTASSLAREKEAGVNVRVVYSPLDAVQLAVDNPLYRVVFLAVGFETTAPAVAAAILTAVKKGLRNFFVLSSHKQVPPALRVLLALPETKLDGLLLPGHVCMITGLAPYAFLPVEYHKPAVVTGFGALDILRAIMLIMLQVSGVAETRLENAYPSVVRPDGNPVAQQMLEVVFEPDDSEWRGLGVIAASGLRLRREYQDYNAEYNLPVAVAESREPEGCRCGDVLRGFVQPPACSLFGKACLPVQPIGACMVSAEGACAAWYRYGQGRWLA
ncbi:MAG: hypD [Anaerosporomusa subterranea]|nr:hypD [Anaerosporomusa subterranea]